MTQRGGTKTPDRPQAVKPVTRAQERARDARFRRFAKNVVACNFNFSEAARRTGYSARSANKLAYELMHRPDVQAMVAEEMGQSLEKVGADAERTLSECAKLAYGDLRDDIKIRAIALLMKYHGHLKERLEHSGPNGQPLPDMIRVTLVGPPRDRDG